MKRLYSSLVAIACAMVFVFAASEVMGQTNPTPQTLPYSQDFSDLPHSSTIYPDGWQGWQVSNIATSFPTGAATADRVLVANSSAGSNAGGVHNFDGKIGLLSSGTVNPALVLAISTVGQNDIVISYDAMWIRREASSTRINEMALQYRVGISGDFTTVAGSEYQNIPGTATSGTTPQDVELIVVTLPSDAEDESVVQLRWVNRDVTGGGSRPSFAIDNISVTSEGEPPVLPPTVAFVSTSASASEGSILVPIDVSLTNYAGTPVTVDVALTEGNPAEFVPAYITQQLTFTNNGVQTMNLDLNEDGIYTGDRSVVFTLQNPGGDPDAIIGTADTFTLTILETTPEPPAAGVLVFYPFTGNSPTPTAIEAGLTASDFEISSGNVSYGTAQGVTWNEGSGVPYAQGSGGWNAPDQEAAKYFEFTVTPDNDKMLVINQIDFAHRRTGAGPQLIGITIGGTVVLSDYSLSQDATVYDSFSFTELTLIAPTTIRIQGWAGGTGDFRIDDVTLFGVVEDLPDNSTVITGGKGWQMLSSPANAATVQDLADANLVYGIPGEYEKTDDANPLTGYDGETFTVPSSLGQTLVPGKGFIWYLWDTDYDEGYVPYEGGGSSENAHLPFLLTFSGSPVAGDHSVQFTEDDRVSGGGDEWYLIGNPYTSPHSVADIYPDSGELSEIFQYWDGTAYVPLDAAEEDEAAVVAGFFAEFITLPNLPVIITYGPEPAPPIRNAAERFTAFFELSGELTVASEVYEAGDQVRVVFSDEATNGRDRLDAGKLNPLSYVWATIAPLAVEGDEFVRRAVESRPVPTETVTVPMAFSTYASGFDVGGTLTISLSNNALGEGWQVSLLDLETSTVTNLLADSYTFSIAGQPAIDGNQRFEITFTPPTVSGEDSSEGYAFGLEAVWPNPTTSTSQVAFTLENTGEISLDVFDVLGRRVAQVANGEYGAGRHILPLSTGSLASGVYVVRLTAGPNVAVQRVTVAR